MPQVSAQNPGDQLTGFSISPSQTRRFDTPAVCESRSDQANATMTAERESTETRMTSQTTWALRRMRVTK